MEHPKLRVSIVQAPCKLEDTVHNTKVILDNLRHLSGKTDLVVFPELFISGYRFSIESSDSLSEPACGPTFQAISQAALRHQVAVIYGFAELDVETKRKYISLMWIDCHGDQVLCYRKTHLYDPDLCTFENVVFSAGDALAPVTTILNVKVGVLICWDVEVPEPSRCLAMAGADFIIAIAANTDAKVNDIIVPARSIDNQVHMAYCNMAGGPYCGKSVVVAPNGTVLGKLGSEDGVATVVIDPLNAEYTRHRLRNPLWRDRRPELYGSLAQLK